MPLVVRYERDINGFPRAVAFSPHEPVGWYLEQDVQGCVASAAEVLRSIDEVASGRLPRWEGTGNAHHLTLAAGSAVIENVWAEDIPSCCVPLAEFRDAVSGWLAFVRSDSERSAPVDPPAAGR